MVSKYGIADFHREFMGENLLKQRKCVERLGSILWDVGSCLAGQRKSTGCNKEFIYAGDS